MSRRGTARGGGAQWGGKKALTPGRPSDPRISEGREGFLSDGRGAKLTKKRSIHTRAHTQVNARLACV